MNIKEVAWKTTRNEEIVFLGLSVSSPKSVQASNKVDINASNVHKLNCWDAAAGLLSLSD